MDFALIRPQSINCSVCVSFALKNGGKKAWIFFEKKHILPNMFH